MAGGWKALLRMEQSALAQVKPISAVKTYVSKSGVAMTCPLLGERSPASQMPCGVLMPLCKRCDVCIAAKDRRLKSGWTLLLEFFFLSFSLFFWQVVCAWAVLAAQDGIGLLQYDSSTARAGLTDLAGVQRGASGAAGHRPAGFTGGGSLHPAKSVATGGGTKQSGTRRGCGAERNGLGVPREVGSNGVVNARKKYPVLLNQRDPPSEGKKVLVERGLSLWEDLPRARGGIAWESPTQGGLLVLQERCL